MTPIKVSLVNSTPSGSLTKSFEPSLNNVDLVKSMPVKDLKAYYENPIRMAESTNYKNKPSSLSYNVLYQMSVKNSIIAAVIGTRINQVSRFTQPARFSDDGIGFKIRLRDNTQTPTDEQKAIMSSIELFLENCGFTDDESRDDFDTFIRKIVRDSLTYDQMCFEIIPDRKGKPAEIYAVDAATIRAASENYEPDNSWGNVAPKKNEEVKWVQVIDGSVVSWFTSKELAFGVRNPRTNINLQPYGFSELEQLIQQVTSHLFAEEYNSKYFSQGGTTKGIINIKSDPNGIGNKEQLESFKRQWRAQVNGMSGAWKTPVLQVPNGIEYVNVSQSNRDMEFSQWMNYLVNIICAIYAIDPAEVNFANNGGASGQTSLFESSQEQKLKNSKDKGLKPLLRFVETMLNKYIISKFSQEYVFVFVGLDDKSEEEKAELESKQVKTWRTINEVRKEHGEPALEYGDILLDPAYINYVTQQEQAKQMQEMGMDPNDPTGGGMPPGGEIPPEEEQGEEGVPGEQTNEESEVEVPGAIPDQEDGETDQDITPESNNDYSDYLSDESADLSPSEQAESQEDEETEEEESEEDEEEKNEKTEKSYSKLIISLDD